MAQGVKLTDSANEMSFSEYFGKQQQITIPVFQRRYDWIKTQLDPWFSDLNNYADNWTEENRDEDVHFCGTIISKKKTQTNYIDQVHLIDGQQRYVTSFLILLAITRKYLNEMKPLPWKSEANSGGELPRTDWVREVLEEKPVHELALILDNYRQAFTKDSGIRVAFIAANEIERGHLMGEVLRVQEEVERRKRDAISLEKITELANFLFFDHSTYKYYRGSSNLKICVSKDDRTSMNNVVQEVTGLPNWIKNQGTLPLFVPFSDSAISDPGKIPNAWRHIKKYIDQEWSNKAGGGLPRLQALKGALLNNFKLIEIVLLDEMQVTKIFDRLNSMGKPLTLGQLVKNDVFGRLSGDIKEMEDLADQLWSPFEDGFKFTGNERTIPVLRRKLNQVAKYSEAEVVFEDYLFPFGLITIDPDVKKSQMYSELSKAWSGNRPKSNHTEPLDSQTIMGELTKYQDDYMDIAFGTNRRLAGKFSEGIERLIRLDYPSTIYPFTIRLSNSVFHKQTSMDEACDTLALIESYLVRRAVCERGTQGLHALFKTMWKEQQELAEGNSTLNLCERITTLLKQKIGTHPWPDDDTFKTNLLNGDIYNQRKVCRFLLEEWEDKHSRNNNLALQEDYEIEHIYPQSSEDVPYWNKHFHTSRKRNQEDKEEEIESNKRHKHRLGNLTILTPRDNKDGRNDSWPVKKGIYRSDNYFKSPQEITKWMEKENYEDWTPEVIQNRTEVLSDWAMSKWTHSP